ncbi:MAG: regulatory protein RecX [Lachnospiraceae bacterium]|nr:regulatory protein RecX [Lachnospiraceae bacterium]
MLYSSEVGEYGLAEGMELSAGLYKNIEELTLKPRCKRRILHLLDRYDKTEAQVRLKLKEEFYPEAVIDEAIAAASRGRYIDDKRYALQYTYEKSHSKSRRMISAELKSRGVSEELIEKALSETEDNEEELIRRCILKKRPDFSTITYEEKQRLLGSICRKGFDADKCMRVYNELAAQSSGL